MLGASYFACLCVTVRVCVRACAWMRVAVFSHHPFPPPFFFLNTEGISIAKFKTRRDADGAVAVAGYLALAVYASGEDGRATSRVRVFIIPSENLQGPVAAGEGDELDVDGRAEVARLQASLQRQVIAKDDKIDRPANQAPGLYPDRGAIVSLVTTVSPEESWDRAADLFHATLEGLARPGGAVVEFELSDDLASRSVSRSQRIHRMISYYQTTGPTALLVAPEVAEHTIVGQLLQAFLPLFMRHFFSDVIGAGVRTDNGHGSDCQVQLQPTTPIERVFGRFADVDAKSTMYGGDRPKAEATFRSHPAEVHVHCQASVTAVRDENFGILHILHKKGNGRHGNVGVFNEDGTFVPGPHFNLLASISFFVTATGVVDAEVTEITPVARFGELV